MDHSSLEAKGLKVNYKLMYRGEPPRTGVPVESCVENIFLPLSADDWCSLCMHEGDSYIGSCCGQTSYIQDMYNSFFREGAWVSGNDLIELISLCKNHEGFELYHEPLTQEKFEEYVKNWGTLGPIDKIGLCCQAVSGKIFTSRLGDVPKSEHQPDEIHILERALRTLSWTDIFSDNRDDGKQHHAGRQLLIARIIPSCKKVLEELPKRFQTFDGFALVKNETEVCSNGFGTCVYADEVEARKVLKLWQDSDTKQQEIEEEDHRSSEQTEFLSKLRVRKIRITLENGLVFTD